MMRLVDHVSFYMQALTANGLSPQGRGPPKSAQLHCQCFSISQSIHLVLFRPQFDACPLLTETYSWNDTPTVCFSGDERANLRRTQCSAKTRIEFGSLGLQRHLSRMSAIMLDSDWRWGNNSVGKAIKKDSCHWVRKITFPSRSFVEKRL